MDEKSSDVGKYINNISSITEVERKLRAIIPLFFLVKKVCSTLTTF